MLSWINANWMIDWSRSIERSIDRLIDWLIDWLIDNVFVYLTIICFRSVIQLLPKWLSAIRYRHGAVKLSRSVIRQQKSEHQCWDDWRTRTTFSLWATFTIEQFRCSTAWSHFDVIVVSCLLHCYCTGKHVIQNASCHHKSCNWWVVWTYIYIYNFNSRPSRNYSVEILTIIPIQNIRNVAIEKGSKLGLNMWHGFASSFEPSKTLLVGKNRILGELCEHICNCNSSRRYSVCILYNHTNNRTTVTRFMAMKHI